MAGRLITVKEFVKVLESLDGDKYIAFEWDGGLSVPVGKPELSHKTYIFDISNYGNMGD